MSLNNEITRLQTAKATLKTKLNARNDNQHQIDDETIDEYGDFVDSIPQGGGDIDWSEIGYSAEPQSVTDGFNYAKQIYDNWDSTQTNLTNKLRGESNLIYMPLVDTSNATNFDGMLATCIYLENLPLLNTSNGTTFYEMLCECQYLKSIPLLDVSSGTNFSRMFESCFRLTSIPQLDVSNGSMFGSTFKSCYALSDIPQLNLSKAVNIYNMFASCSALTTFGGLLNLGQAFLTTKSANYYEYTLKLSASTLLTHDSLMNVINGLYDIATKGCNAQQLQLGSTNLAKLTAEEISTASNKGWSVS